MSIYVTLPTKLIRSSSVLSCDIVLWTVQEAMRNIQSHLLQLGSPPYFYTHSLRNYIYLLTDSQIAYTTSRFIRGRPHTLATGGSDCSTVHLLGAQVLFTSRRSIHKTSALSFKAGIKLYFILRTMYSGEYANSIHSSLVKYQLSFALSHCSRSRGHKTSNTPSMPLSHFTHSTTALPAFVAYHFSFSSSIIAKLTSGSVITLSLFCMRLIGRSRAIMGEDGLAGNRIMN